MAQKKCIFKYILYKKQCLFWMWPMSNTENTNTSIFCVCILPLFNNLMYSSLKVSGGPGMFFTAYMSVKNE